MNALWNRQNRQPASNKKGTSFLAPRCGISFRTQRGRLEAGVLGLLVKLAFMASKTDRLPPAQKGTSFQTLRLDISFRISVNKPRGRLLSRHSLAPQNRQTGCLHQKQGPHFEPFVLTSHLWSQLTSSVAACEAGILWPPRTDRQTG